jgi:hypothetical protein
MGAGRCLTDLMDEKGQGNPEPDSGPALDP